jgi:predicted metalloprotease with PDZ domain
MPGAYFVGNFATSVADVTATETEPAKKPLRVFHPDPNTWEIGANGASSISVQYTLKNADLEEISGEPTRGHISGPRTYMYVEGRKAEPVELELATPTGAKLWNIATSLDPISEGGKSKSNGSMPEASTFKAPTYDVLADAPVEMGNFADDTFTAAGAPHHVILYGDYKNIDKAKLKDYCQRIANVETSFFGGAPFARYFFEFRATSAGSRGAGGLEHLGSTEIGTIGDVNDRVRSVIAHEYFHAWNVKRIRPFVLGPFNYVDPPHTANLWWSEGVTSYYGDLLSLRGGLNTRDEYLKHVGDTIGMLQNTAARLKVSADESSLRVWEANNSSGFANMSYYTKGELIGLCLDLKIRHETMGRVSLDDVMRALFAQVRHGDGPGFGEDDIKKTVNRITGKDLSEFYDTVARSTEELPFEECLGYAGLSLARIEPPKMQGDSGMTFSFGRGAGGLTISEITANGAAEKAGLKVGDRITAVNGSSEGRGLGGAFASAKPGDTVKLTISRSGSTNDINLIMGSRSVYSWSVTAIPSASPEQVQLRDAWLKAQ